MKKGFTSLLLLLLLMMAPTISLASEIENGLTNTIDDLAEAVKTAAYTNGTNETAAVPEGVGSLVNASIQTRSTVQSQQTSEVQKSNQLLGIELNLPVAGKINLGLNAGGKSDASSNQTAASSSGLIDLEISDSNVLGDVKVGVLNSGTQTGENNAGGFVSVDAATSLVDFHIGIGNSLNEENSTVTEPIEESVIESEVTQPVNKPFQPNETSRPAIPSKPVNQSENQDKTESSNRLFPLVNDDDQTLETPVDILEQIDLGYDIGIYGNLFKSDFLTDYGTADSFSSAEQIQSQLSPEELEELRTVLKNLNDEENQQAVSPTGAMSTTGSGSGSTGASNANGGLGIAALLSPVCLCEVELSNQVSKQQVELSDQWSKSPPIDPPQVSFFLYA